MGIRGLLLLAFVLVLPLPARAQLQLQTCSTISQVTRVRDVMADIYLWYQHIPPLVVARFDSPEEYLEAARYRPLDSTFSYITDAESNSAFFGESAYAGFGFSTSSETGEMRITQVYPGSPASEAGIDRGDRIVAIDGVPTSSLFATGAIGTAFGPAEAGVTREIAFEGNGTRTTVALTKRVVTIPTVSVTRVYEVAGRRVGYIFFRNFVRPSTAALDAAFTELKRQRVTELVLDLRYNGGGLVSVAQHLADLIGGSLTAGQVFAEYSHNDRNTHRNETLRFGTADQALTLSRVVMIMTQASASASELIANALRPHMPVVLIGDRTYGKPVGQYQVEFCRKVFAVVGFSLTNALGQADYFGGLAPTCHAPDDLDRQIGDPQEASLAEAFFFIDQGRCSSTFTPLVQPRRVRPTQRSGGDGWQELIGAH